MKVAVAFDHRGVHLREEILQALVEDGHEIVDLGTDTDAHADRLSGQGARARRGDPAAAPPSAASSSAAPASAPRSPRRRCAGIRAAICHDVYSAHQGVEHDDMNVLCLGSEVVGPSLARELVRAFLGARFDGGERYVERLRKVEVMERQMSNG